MTVLTHPSSVGGLARGSLSSLQPFDVRATDDRRIGAVAIAGHADIDRRP